MINIEEVVRVEINAKIVNQLDCKLSGIANIGNCNDQAVGQIMEEIHFLVNGAVKAAFEKGREFERKRFTSDSESVEWVTG